MEQELECEPMGYKKPIMSVGEEFVAWAESYWRLEEKYMDQKNCNNESSSYPHTRQIFIDHINRIIQDRVDNYM